MPQSKLDHETALMLQIVKDGTHPYMYLKRHNAEHAVKYASVILQSVGKSFEDMMKAANKEFYEPSLLTEAYKVDTFQQIFFWYLETLVCYAAVSLNVDTEQAEAFLDRQNVEILSHDQYYSLRYNDSELGFFKSLAFSDKDTREMIKPEAILQKIRDM